jgi:hypothetical protein
MYIDQNTKVFIPTTALCCTYITEQNSEIKYLLTQDTLHYTKKVNRLTHLCGTHQYCIHD